ncbi:xanthine dehydrogenase YagS FAD-binding subunit [Flavobacterium nitrogenifigens]|uniref:Xanthine dehydrogenase YagS FAD-binding subunit n=2 Tax=Flavobacterium TaxID=237 RepID=A0A7W7N8C1_9FLAO|nr:MULTISPECIES: xanthine dehydrogenase family protein subunit M [Flavobacterium]MBB4802291.1 xanthine dehydrogenase YagS FAD-binding subunit [Flavobacterium nitrogenifigens]MBB6387249.1 xanthine dehydrogenase YagS FAD-binding subunit [Flavobacterium notoginsengisoli]
MKNFQIIKALSSSSAVTGKAKDNSSMFIAGGTNLVDLMKKNVVAPDKLVDINGLDLKKIEFLKGKVSIGALAKNSQVAEDSSIKEKHPLLALALAAGASQQIRNMATVGGNMLQRTRCSYFYNTDMPCNKRVPKSGCGAIGGSNRMSAIFGASDSCIAVHPSDMCVALAALDATVLVEGPKGKRQINFTDFHRLPGNTPEKDNTLENRELITSVEIPDHNFTKNVHYLKVRDRTSYAFALVSVAVALDLKNNVINNARLAMGGVAHKPWRLFETEEFLKGKTVSEEIFRQAANLSMKGARGYGENDFKLTLGANAITEALTIAASK